MIYNGFCENNDNTKNLNIKCSMVQNQEFTQIINIFPTSTQGFEGTILIDSNTEQNLVTLISAPNDKSQKITTSTVQLGEGNNIKSSYFGVHPQDFSKRTGTLNYFIWSTENSSKWALNICWSDSLDFDCEKNKATLTSTETGIPVSVFCPREIHRVEGISNQFDLLLNCGQGSAQVQRIEFQSPEKISLLNTVYINHPILGNSESENIRICPTGQEFLILNPDQGTFMEDTF